MRKPLVLFACLIAVLVLLPTGQAAWLASISLEGAINTAQNQYIPVADGVEYPACDTENDAIGTVISHATESGSVYATFRGGTVYTWTPPPLIQEPSTEVIQYRVILDGVQVIALMDQARAEQMLRDAIANGQAKTGMVQRHTDAVNVLEQWSDSQQKLSDMSEHSSDVADVPRQSPASTPSVGTQHPVSPSLTTTPLKNGINPVATGSVTEVTANNSVITEPVTEQVSNSSTTTEIIVHATVADSTIMSAKDTSPEDSSIDQADESDQEPTVITSNNASDDIAAVINDTAFQNTSESARQAETAETPESDQNDADHESPEAQESEEVINPL